MHTHSHIVILLCTRINRRLVVVVASPLSGQPPTWSAVCPRRRRRRRTFGSIQLSCLVLSVGHSVRGVQSHTHAHRSPAGKRSAEIFRFADHHTRTHARREKTRKNNKILRKIMIFCCVWERVGETLTLTPSPKHVTCVRRTRTHKLAAIKSQYNL